MSQIDENMPLSPEASLALVRDQQLAARRGLDVDPALFRRPGAWPGWPATACSSCATARTAGSW